ncbi:MAG: TonB-dependent receptor [Novosphingobium sp.]|uniref:TonB-dependent receptor domain-containing protein n=1 Tax=Novosphingobium sp. TaxID=1874826 RepID=UPI0032BCC495
MNSRILARVAYACSASLVALSTPAFAQELPDSAAQSAETKEAPIIVTGSRIKRDPSRSSVPLQIFTNTDLERAGVQSSEQMNMFLTSNGSGADNLASNSDVVTGAQRGTNGLSAANLRGQGSGSTLILLNGRRVAAHGLSGGAVDVNQIPFALVERVEVLKDGASAIYGTDAIGGVINYITRKNFTGFSVSGMADVTEQGGGNIYRVSGAMGIGDLDEDGINIMGGVSYSWNKMLRGSQRDFVNGNQPGRGLSIDTRGTPIASLFNIGTNTFQNPTGSLLAGLVLTAPNGGNAAAGGINILDLPGGAGCESMDGGMAYDWELWTSPDNYYACAWDTGRAAVIQQPIETLTYYSKVTIKLGSSQLFGEVTGSSAESAKSFSHAQVTANTGNLPWAYPLNGNTTATYNAIFNSLLNAFPGSAATLNARYGRPLSGRWRCIACGPREYVTNTRTLRAMVGIEGPIGDGAWDYRMAASHAESESSSLLGSGYYYRGTLSNGASDLAAPTAPGATAPGLLGLINAGILNPFSLTQTDAAISGLAAVSAEGTTLYGGRYTVKEFDASVSGPLFDLPAGKVQIALGAAYRKETYSFNGSPAAATNQPVIFLAAFDNVNALTPKSRNIASAYAEVLIPVFEGFEITGAFRLDDYTLFGSTTNPKVSFKYQASEWLMFRGSYNTSFRVPGFNQLYNGITTSPYSGSDIADPVSCPGGVPTTNTAGFPCSRIRPDIINRGNLNLVPETAVQASLGVVFRPNRQWTLSVDWWMINVDDPIAIVSIRDYTRNALDLQPYFIRNLAGVITAIDQPWLNTGARRTQGLEIALRGGFDMAGMAKVNVGLDGTYLLQKRDKVTPGAQYLNQLGVFSFANDLGLRWKHNAWISYNSKDFAITFTQVFRSSYGNGALPGIANGTVTRPDYNPRVKPYAIYHLSASLLSLAPGYKMTVGVKNLFNTDPPFAITYDGNSGAGGSWEPRVADPRGRSFNIQVEVKF